MTQTKIAVGMVDASGTPGSGNFLRGDGSWQSASAPWNIIGTSVASDSASLTITGLDSTYDTYCLAFSQLVPATDGATPYLRVGAGSIDSGSSDYSWSVGGTTHSDTTHFLDGHEDNEDSEMELTATTDMGGVGSAAGEGFNATLWMNRPADGTTRVGIGGTAAYYTTNSNCVGQHITAARRAVITLDRIQFLFSSGNVATGRFTVYGIAHA